MGCSDVLHELQEKLKKEMVLHVSHAENTTGFWRIRHVGRAEGVKRASEYLSDIIESLDNIAFLPDN